MVNGNAPRCKKISLDKLVITPLGMAVPQCQNCIHTNCGNPIEKFKVSVMGVTKEWRLYNNHGVPLAVFECEHYAPDAETFKSKVNFLD
jgi:hypothetical protein